MKSYVHIPEGLLHVYSKNMKQGVKLFSSVYKVCDLLAVDLSWIAFDSADFVLFKNDY